ncbi:MAG: type II toxin-antitoxin system PemK/MazF family toxin [Crenarchaeota archaeon]|nr:type II toxin-antitoxin system PemK/MazF family toxin [Thermoproteota archaeon]MDW8034586.1 type II toxin-antitoxin system PemK/MazF family toxin [Nitrososphaerota archaeon]
MKGKIVLVPFPFTNLTAVKLRPALVLFEGERDVVVAFISSRIPDELKPTDVLIKETHPDFKITGLKTSSVIKLDKIATLLKSMIIGEIGEIGPQIKKEINEKIIKAYFL